MVIKKIIFIVIAAVISMYSVAEAIPLSNLFKQVNPTVVVIQTVERGISTEKPGETVTSGGLGSGVVISKDGYIMTAAHLVHVADAVAVHFADGTEAKADVIASAELADVALIKLQSVQPNLRVAKLGNSDQVQVGDEVFVVGAPYGIAHTLTKGIISGRRRPPNFEDQLIPLEFLQTDASVNKGNSGGPMFNMKGEVIGIVSFILSESGGFEGIGFAASINVAKEILFEQKSFWTGIDGYFLTGKIAKALNVPQEAGILIQRLAQDSPGQQLGLNPGDMLVKIGEQSVVIGGDIILAVENIPFSTDAEALQKIRETVLSKPGLKGLKFKVLRGGKVITLVLKE
jgi:S1-C subfamily serine protease